MQLAIIANFVSGGGKRDRTADLLHAMQALSQLSYTPIPYALQNRLQAFGKIRIISEISVCRSLFGSASSEETELCTSDFFYASTLGDRFVVFVLDLIFIKWKGGLTLHHPALP